MQLSHFQEIRYHSEMNSKAHHIILALAIVSCILGSCQENTSKQTGSDAENEKNLITSKLFLLSKGLTTDTLKNEFLGLLEKAPEMNSVAVIVNASTSDKKKIKKTKKVKAQFAEMGFDSTRIGLFDLLKTPPTDLTNFDIIYILGGNPFVLLRDVHKSGSQKVLKELAYQNKILMGYSAGSLLLGPDLSLMQYTDSLLGFNQIELKELSCVGLYDFYIFPHYDDFTTQAPELKSKIEAFESLSSLPIYRLNDNQGIISLNGDVQIIGK